MTDNSNSLAYEKKTVYEKVDRAVLDSAFAYAEDYRSYLDRVKTEREAVENAIALAEAKGFLPFSFGGELKVGGKYYYNNRNKSLFLFRIGTEDIGNGIRIVAAHADAPRLDLKQVPLYEESGLGFFKTHYYGGIRKYQWMTTPLALHGVVVKQNGETVRVIIGEDENEPCLYITDLLPHLAAAENAKTVSAAFPAEKLNLLVGSLPAENIDKNAVRETVLRYLFERYGIVEEDLQSAELCAVPALKARDIGFDRSLVGGYGQDDRACAFPALTAMLDADESKHTTMCILADKEEVGSDGVSGMQCCLVADLIAEIARALGGNDACVRAHSFCLSADTTALYDPNFPDVFEKKNSAMAGCGVVMSKYTGVRGKVSASDASAEAVAFIRRILNEKGIIWQSGELGKIDAGGGGTVARFLANRNIETLDIGVGVLSVHAPYECIAKVDLYEAYRAFLAFYRY